MPSSSPQAPVRDAHWIQFHGRGTRSCVDNDQRIDRSATVSNQLPKIVCQPDNGFRTTSSQQSWTGSRRKSLQKPLLNGCQGKSLVGLAVRSGCVRPRASHRIPLLLVADLAYSLFLYAFF